MNTLALLNMYREKGVATVRNQHGQIVFCGMGKLTPSQRKTLLAIPQSDLDAAMRWQQ
jgi:hypothetical protein